MLDNALLESATMALMLLVFILAAPAWSRSEATDTLLGGQSLGPFEHLDSGQYQLLMDSNTCTLKLFKASDNKPLWESEGGLAITYRDIGDCKLTLHRNSNLVISSPASPVIWESGTAGSSYVNMRCRLHVIDLFGVLGMAVVHCAADLEPYNFAELPYWSTGMR